MRTVLCVYACLGEAGGSRCLLLLEAFLGIAGEGCPQVLTVVGNQQDVFGDSRWQLEEAFERPATSASAAGVLQCGIACWRHAPSISLSALPALHSLAESEGESALTATQAGFLAPSLLQAPIISPSLPCWGMHPPWSPTPAARPWRCKTRRRAGTLRTHRAAAAQQAQQPL